jgi:putative thioredoxin
MNASRHVFEATAENFRELVLGNSERGPVLVNFWAAWAGPCLKLWPTLEKLAHEYGGRFLLVNFDTDKYKALAREQGVTSLPTLKLYRRGAVVAEVHGAESEASLRQLLDQHVARPSDAALARLVARVTQAVDDDLSAALRTLCESDPDNPRLVPAAAKLLLGAGRHDAAVQLLEAQPEPRNDESGLLLAHAHFLHSAATAPARSALEQRIACDENDLEARYQLAARLLVESGYEDALAALIEIVRRDRRFHDGLAARGMLALFALLGSEHALTQQYRPLLFNLLH